MFNLVKILTVPSDLIRFGLKNATIAGNASGQSCNASRSQTTQSASLDRETLCSGYWWLQKEGNRHSRFIPKWRATNIGDGHYSFVVPLDDDT